MLDPSTAHIRDQFQVLSDVARRRAYDEKLRQEELSIVPHKHHASSHQVFTNMIPIIQIFFFFF